MSKAGRIYNALLKHNGKQVGGANSNRIEIDLSVLLELFALEDYIKELEYKITQQEVKLVNYHMAIEHPGMNRKNFERFVKNKKVK